jgi:DNA-binding MarR family transcriptional regulator
LALFDQLRDQYLLRPINSYTLSVYLQVELRQLRSLVALTETLHFGRAARAMGISQPSLTHQLQRLEKDLRVQLVSRTKRRVRLTEAGLIFLGEARAIVAQADRAAAMALRAGVGEIGRLSIGLGPWTDGRKVLPAVREFAKRYPSVHLELRSMPVTIQVNALRDERIDLGVMRPPISDSAVEGLASALQREDTRLEASEMLRGLIDSIVLMPEKGQLRIELRGNLAAMLTAAQKTRRSPETGDLLMPVQLVAGARNPLNLEFSWTAA